MRNAPVALAVLAALSLGLAACDRGKEDGASFSLNANGSGAAMNGSTGVVSIDTPLFKGSVKLPKIDLTAENFDINGVHLYPGSKIGAVNVDASGDKDGVVNVKFDSPASADTVRGWLQQQFEKAGTKVTVDGNALRGKSDDKTFEFDLTPAGDRTTGTVTIG